MGSGLGTAQGANSLAMRGIVGKAGLTAADLGGSITEESINKNADKIAAGLEKKGVLLRLPDGTYTNTEAGKSGWGVWDSNVMKAANAMNVSNNPYQNPQQNPGSGNTTSTTSDPMDQYITSMLPGVGSTSTNPAGGLASTGTKASSDAQQLLAEAELQKKLSGESADAQKTERAKNLEDLSTLLAKSRNDAFNAARPDIYEDLNSRGLLRSTGLGEAFARKQSELEGVTATELAKQGLADRETNLNLENSIMGNYLGARGGAIQRQFSLEDYANQVATAQKLGFAVPQTPQASSGKGTAGMTGALGGGTIGAHFGPAGALLGAAAGGIAGSSK